MDPEALAVWYGRFVAENLHLAWSPRQPLSGQEFCEALAILAAGSGAFGFVALQQFVANGNLVGRVADGERWPCVGVAFGHLRHAQGPFPQYDGRAAQGFLPWMTGTEVFPQVILGMRGPEAEEIYALVDSTNRPSFRHSAPMDLIACTGTGTVSVDVVELLVDEKSILKRDPAGTFARNDPLGVLYQTPLMVGCVRACHEIINFSPRVSNASRARCELKTEILLRSIHNGFEYCLASEGKRLRAELGDFAVRLARLAVMASGGGGLVRGHPAQRLYREALLYSLMAQTDDIVNQAFQEVLL